MPSEEQAEIAVHAPLFGGENAGKLLRLLPGDLANLQCRVDVKPFKPRQDKGPVSGVLIDILLVLPAFFQNDGNQCAHQQGVRAIGRHDVQICHARRLAQPRIDNDDHLLRITGKAADRPLCVRHLMRDICVAAPIDNDLVVLIIRLQKMERIAENAAVAPPVAHKLHADGIEIILRADGLHQRQCGSGRRCNGIGSAAEKSRRTRTVLLNNGVGAFGNLPVCLLPGNALIVVAHTLFRIEEPIPVLRKVFRRSALAAAVAV